jgi:hypothetical protein
MSVGIPRDLEPSQWNDYFFGFVGATVRAPDNEYIGLLPIKQFLFIIIVIIKKFIINLFT